MSKLTKELFNVIVNTPVLKLRCRTPSPNIKLLNFLKSIKLNIHWKLHLLIIVVNLSSHHFKTRI